MKLLFNKRINQHAQELNEMNYFPCPDNDTGYNLSKTLECLEKIDFTNFKDYLNKLSKNLIFTATGSSGNLLTLFVLGMNNNYSEDWTDMCKKATKFVRDATYGPQEGAFLSVVSSVPEKYDGLKDFLNQYLESAKEIYETGWEKIFILKKNNKRDSGTLGLIYILEDLIDIVDSVKHIYCMEFLFKGNFPEIKEKLTNLGTDIILIPTEEYTKLHIHSTDCKKVLEALEGYEIFNQKIDDNLII